MAESRADDVEKLLHDEESLQSRKQALIDELLKEREAMLKAFDEKLAKLGYHGGSGKPKRNHHKKAAAAVENKPPAKAEKKP